MSYLYAFIISAEINRSYYSHGNRYHYNLRLYAHVMPVFSIDAPAGASIENTVATSLQEFLYSLRMVKL